MNMFLKFFLLVFLFCFSGCSDYSSYYRTKNGVISEKRHIIQKTKILFAPYDEPTRLFKKKLVDLLENQDRENIGYEYVLLVDPDYEVNIGSMSFYGFMTSGSLILNAQYKIYKLDRVYYKDDFANLEKLFEDFYFKKIKKGIKFDSFSRRDEDYKSKDNQKSLFFLNYMSFKDSRKKIKEFEKFNFFSSYLKDKSLKIIAQGSSKNITSFEINGNNLLSTKQNFEYLLEKMNTKSAEEIFWDIVLNL